MSSSSEGVPTAVEHKRYDVDQRGSMAPLSKWSGPSVTDFLKSILASHSEAGSPDLVVWVLTLLFLSGEDFVWWVSIQGRVIGRCAACGGPCDWRAVKQGIDDASKLQAWRHWGFQNARFANGSMQQQGEQQEEGVGGLEAVHRCGQAQRIGLCQFVGSAPCCEEIGRPKVELW